MSAPTTYPMTVRDVLALWLRENRGLAITLLGVLVSSAAFLAALAAVIGRGQFSYMWVNIVCVAYTMTVLMLATLAVRAVGPRDILRAFLSGFFLTMALSYGLAKPLKMLLGNNNFTVAFAVPVLEELGKALAILLIVWSLHRRTARSVGLADLTVVGAAVGSGFFLHEDTLFPRSMTSHMGGSVGELFQHPWALLFPTHFEWFGMLTISHTGWGLMIGFGIGVFLLFPSKRVLGLVSVVACYACAVFGHGIWNMQGVPRGAVAFVGDAQAVLMLLMIIAAIVIDALRRRQRAPDLPRPEVRFYRHAWRLAESKWRLIERVAALTRYRREWNGAAYARARDAQVPDLGQDPGMISWFLLALGPVRVPTPQPQPHTPAVPLPFETPLATERENYEG